MTARSVINRTVVGLLAVVSALSLVVSCRRVDDGLQKYCPESGRERLTKPVRAASGELYCSTVVDGSTEQEVLDWYSNHGFSITTNAGTYRGYNRMGVRFELKRGADRRELKIWHFKDE